MTCASCAARIEKRLNSLDGVDASVNYATEKATINFNDQATDSHITIDELIAAIEQAGYHARLTPQATQAPDTTIIDPAVLLRRRLLISTALTAPVVALAMVSSWQFTYWQWVSLTLAVPVVAWGAWPFHRAAWMNLRHCTSTMDTLVSLGTLAALGWSLYALVFGSAGEPGMTHPFQLSIDRTDGSGNLYFEVAAASPPSC